MVKPFERKPFVTEQCKMKFPFQCQIWWLLFLSQRFAVAAFVLPQPSVTNMVSPPIEYSTPPIVPTVGRKYQTKLSSTRIAVQQLLHSDSTFCLAMVLMVSTLGLELEKRTQFGRALSPPLTTMAIAIVLANIGVMPFESTVYSMINQYLVPLAVPMLLYDANIRKILSDTGRLFQAFLVGALGTLVGTVVASACFPMVDGSVAAALCARHIGGAINFVAVAETCRISGSTVSAAIAADNLIVAIYFALLFALAKSGEEEDDVEKGDGSIVPTVDTSGGEVAFEGDNITLNSLAWALSCACVLVTSGKWLTRYILPAGTSSLPLTSVLTVFLATWKPNLLAPLRASGTALGIIGIQMFFAASGASGSIRLVIEKAPMLLAYSALQIATHFGVFMSLGRGLLRIPSRELFLASNANVGGPTTAAAMAQAKNWKRLVLPALLVGILGYSTATPLALALRPLLLRFSNV